MNPYIFLTSHHPSITCMHQYPTRTVDISITCTIVFADDNIMALRGGDDNQIMLQTAQALLPILLNRGAKGNKGDRGGMRRSNRRTRERGTNVDAIGESLILSSILSSVVSNTSKKRRRRKQRRGQASSRENNAPSLHGSASAPLLATARGDRLDHFMEAQSARRNEELLKGSQSQYEYGPRSTSRSSIFTSPRYSEGGSQATAKEERIPLSLAARKSLFGNSDQRYSVEHLMTSRRPLDATYCTAGK